jgi:hypothetical protein
MPLVLADIIMLRCARVVYLLLSSILLTFQAPDWRYPFPTQHAFGVLRVVEVNYHRLLKVGAPQL